MNVITALINKDSKPDELSKLVYGSIVNKKSDKLQEALTGNLKDHCCQQLEWEKQEYDFFEKKTKQCIRKIRKICQENYSQEMELMKSISNVMQNTKFSA